MNQQKMKLGAFIKKSIKESLEILKHPSRLLPTIALSVAWVVLSVMEAKFKELPAGLAVVSFLTFAQGGMFGGVIGAVGGIVGKTLTAAFLNAMILPVFEKKKPFSNVAGGFKGLFNNIVAESSGGVSPLLKGVGFALLLYGFMNFTQSKENMMVGIMAALMLLSNIGKKGGFVLNLLFSAANSLAPGKTPSYAATMKAISGMTLGMTLGVALTAASVKLCPILGVVFLVLGGFTGLFGKKKRVGKTAALMLVIVIVMSLLPCGFVYAEPDLQDYAGIYEGTWKKYYRQYDQDGNCSDEEITEEKGTVELEYKDGKLYLVPYEDYPYEWGYQFYSYPKIEGGMERRLVYDDNGNVSEWHRDDIRKVVFEEPGHLYEQHGVLWSIQGNSIWLTMGDEHNSELYPYYYSEGTEYESFGGYYYTPITRTDSDFEGVKVDTISDEEETNSPPKDTMGDSSTNPGYSTGSDELPGSDVGENSDIPTIPDDSEFADPVDPGVIETLIDWIIGTIDDKEKPVSEREAAVVSVIGIIVSILTGGGGGGFGPEVAGGDYGPFGTPGKNTVFKDYDYPEVTGIVSESSDGSLTVKLPDTTRDYHDLDKGPTPITDPGSRYTFTPVIDQDGQIIGYDSEGGTRYTPEQLREHIYHLQGNAEYYNSINSTAKKTKEEQYRDNQKVSQEAQIYRDWKTARNEKYKQEDAEAQKKDYLERLKIKYHSDNAGEEDLRKAIVKSSEKAVKDYKYHMERADAADRALSAAEKILWATDRAIEVGSVFLPPPAAKALNTFYSTGKNFASALGDGMGKGPRVMEQNMRNAMVSSIVDATQTYTKNPVGKFVSNVYGEAVKRGMDTYTKTVNAGKEVDWDKINEDALKGAVTGSFKFGLDYGLSKFGEMKDAVNQVKSSELTGTYRQIAAVKSYTDKHTVNNMKMFDQLARDTALTHKVWDYSDKGANITANLINGSLSDSPQEGTYTFNELTSLRSGAEREFENWKKIENSAPKLGEKMTDHSGKKQ